MTSLFLEKLGVDVYSSYDFRTRDAAGLFPVGGVETLLTFDGVERCLGS